MQLFNQRNTSCHELSSCLHTTRLIICLFQTTSELRRKYSEYLDHHGYEQSVLSTGAFDAIWVAAKTLNASIERLQPNETIDQFSYDNSRMTKIFFDSLTKLQFEGASVSCGIKHVCNATLQCICSFWIYTMTVKMFH